MPKWARALTAVRITRRERDTVYLESEGTLSEMVGHRPEMAFRHERRPKGSLFFAEVAEAVLQVARIKPEIEGTGDAAIMQF